MTVPSRPMFSSITMLCRTSISMSRPLTTSCAITASNSASATSWARCPGNSRMLFGTGDAASVPIFFLGRRSCGGVMPAKARSFHAHEHDWHSAAYVGQWIDQDVTRDAERRPILRKMISFAPFEKNAAIRALDIGAGYGVVTEEVLRAFPKARVTWQDYSRPMRDQAQKRLTKYEKRLAYIVSDLTDASWNKE